MPVNKDTIFLNADYIVIEYLDILKSPYFSLLRLLKRNKKIYEVLAIEKIENYSDAALYEWYLNRKHRNFFKDLVRFPDMITDENLDKMLEMQLNENGILYEMAGELHLMQMLASIIDEKMVKEVIIYHPYKNDHAKKDLEKKIGRDVTFMNDFHEILKKVGYDSTFFLSDIKLIDVMEKAGYLNLSSITLACDYRYNKKNMTEMDIDLENLLKRCTFKLSYFSVFGLNVPQEIKGEKNEF